MVVAVVVETVMITKASFYNINKATHFLCIQIVI